MPQLGKIQLAKLGPEHIRGMHASMRRAGKSPTTIRNAHATLRKALGAALTERRIAYNWAKEVSAPAAADNPHDQLTIDEAGNASPPVTRASSRASTSRSCAGSARAKRSRSAGKTSPTT